MVEMFPIDESVRSPLGVVAAEMPRALLPVVVMLPMELKISEAFDPARMPVPLSPEVLMSAIEERTTLPVLDAKMPMPPPVVTINCEPVSIDTVMGLVEVNSTPFVAEAGAMSAVRLLMRGSCRGWKLIAMPSD